MRFVILLICTVGLLKTTLISSNDANCVQKEQECALMNSPACKSIHAYAGNHSVTISGLTCQRWDSQSAPHKHIQNNATKFPNFDIHHNHCRNPDAAGPGEGPWCYTTNPNVRWEYCFGACRPKPLGFIDKGRVKINSNLEVRPLQGMLQFAQTHTIYPNGNDVKNLPTLITQRDALVIYIPAEGEEISSLKLTTSIDGQEIAAVAMKPPSKFPKSDQSNLDDDNRPEVQYSLRAWSTVLKSKYVKYGLSLTLKDNAERIGTLLKDQIDFAPPQQLLLQFIRFGMLTAPPSVTYFEAHTETALPDYFQKIPFAKLIAGFYQPVQFDKIVMPGGQVYTDFDPSVGSRHGGDMRFSIAKVLVANGINNANRGLTDSEGNRHFSPIQNERFNNMITVHTVSGKYSNGVVQHGLSGGGGIATVARTHGNEFTHMLGLVYGARRNYEQDFQHTGWKYDAWRNRMIASLNWKRKGVNESSWKPGPYQYTTCTMNGGHSSSSCSSYPSFVGSTAMKAQLDHKNQMHPEYSTDKGWEWVKWDAEKKQMLPTVFQACCRPKVPALQKVGVPVVTVVGFYDPMELNLTTYIYPPLVGSYGYVYKLPEPNLTQEGKVCFLEIAYNNDQNLKINLYPHTRPLNNGHMNKFHVNLLWEKNLVPKNIWVKCVNDGVAKVLAERKLELPNIRAVKKDPMMVGKEHGYTQVADPSSQVC